MISDDDYQNWLTKAAARRCLLVELTHTAGVEYVATAPYIGEPVTRDNTHRVYEDRVSSVVSLSERIDGRSEIGTITVINDGDLNAWHGYQWRTGNISIYLGDLTWHRRDFRLVASLPNSGLAASRAGEISFSVSDGRSALEVPLHEYRAETENKEYGFPAVFGSVLHVPAVLINAVEDEYILSGWEDGPASIYSYPDIHDSGAVVSDPDVRWLSNSRFQLKVPAQGPVSASTIRTYGLNKPAEIVQFIAGVAGLTVKAELLDALPDRHLSLYYQDGTKTTCRQVLDDLVLQIGGYWRVSLTGELEVAVLEAPAEPGITITPDDIFKDGLRLIRTEPAWRQCSVDYYKNFYVLSPGEIAGSVSDFIKGALTREWFQQRTFKLSDADTVEASIAVDVQIPNYDGYYEADRRLQLRSADRQVWECECFLAPALISVGDTVKIIHPGISPFADGVDAVVFSKRPSFTEERIKLEVWF